MQRKYTPYIVVLQIKGEHHQSALYIHYPLTCMCCLHTLLLGRSLFIVLIGVMSLAIICQVILFKDCYEAIERTLAFRAGFYFG